MPSTREPTVESRRLPARLARVFSDGPRPDAVTVLTIFLVLTYAMPSDLTLGALGGAGSPGSLWCLAAGLWWCWYQLQRPSPRSAETWPPPRIAIVLFLGAGLASFVAAALRPISAVELSQADTGLLKILSWVGLVLLASDGIPSRDRLHLIFRRVVTTGGLFATLGLLQFLTGQSLISWFGLPGFNSSQNYSSVQERNGFIRSAATAMHPLEYAMVLCMILPLALNLALHDSTRSWIRRWWPVAAITLAASLSVSRSTLLGVAAGLIVLVPTWPSGIRRMALLIAAAFGGAIYVLVPGMAGTVVYLFSGIASDQGAASRTNSYGLVEAFFLHSPLVGRGIGTFLPEYRILDNQYLLLLVEAGILGVMALLGLMFSAVRATRPGRRSATCPLDRSIGQALVASVVAGAVLIAFFDAFSFPKAGATLFLFIGLSAGYWRFNRGRETDPPADRSA